MKFVWPNDKALGAFPWIWDRIEAYWSPRNRPEAFCGALRSPVSCSSCADLAVCVDLPEMMLDRSSSIASILGGFLERELRVDKATRIDHQASFLADWRERLNRHGYNLQAISRLHKKLQVCSLDFGKLQYDFRSTESLVIWLYKSKL